MLAGKVEQELSCRRQMALYLCNIMQEDCYGTVWFIIYNTDLRGRKCGEKKFSENLVAAGFQFSTYGTASHHDIIRPWSLYIIIGL